MARVLLPALLLASGLQTATPEYCDNGLTTGKDCLASYMCGLHEVCVPSFYNGKCKCREGFCKESYDGVCEKRTYELSEEEKDEEEGDETQKLVVAVGAAGACALA